jgi:hypothetical protein
MTKPRSDIGRIQFQDIIFNFFSSRANLFFVLHEFCSRHWV